MMSLRALAAPLVLFFIYAAVVQLNDPDPLGWLLIYGGAALVAAVQLFRPLWAPCALVAAAAVAYAAALVPQWLREVEPPAQAFFDSEMNRELMGLSIVAVTSTMLLLLARRASQLPKRS